MATFVTDGAAKQRRRTVHLARAVAASSPTKRGVTTGTIAAWEAADEADDKSLKEGRVQHHYDKLSAPQQAALKGAFLTRAKFTLDEILTRQDFASLDVLLDAHAIKMKAIVEAHDEHEAELLQYWTDTRGRLKKSAAGGGQRRASTSRYSDAQDFIHNLQRLTNKMLPRLHSDNLLDNAGDIVASNRRVAKLITKASTQRRARIEMVSFLKQNSLSTVDRDLELKKQYEAEGARMEQAFHNNLTLQSSVMDITANHGNQSSSGRLSEGEERKLERELEGKRQSDLTRHYEHLMAALDTEIQEYSGSQTSNACLALDDLAGERGIDALTSCISAARSGIKRMAATDAALRELMKQSQKSFNDQNNSLLQGRQQKLEDHYTSLVEHIQALIDQQVEVSDGDFAANEVLIKNQNEDALNQMEQRRKMWKQKYSESLSQHLENEKAILQRMGDSIISTGVEAMQETMAKGRVLNGSSARVAQAAEHKTMCAETAAKLKAVDTRISKRVDWILETVTASYDATSKLRIIVAELQRLDKEKRFCAPDSVRARRLDLLIATNMALSQAAREDPADRIRRLSELARSGDVPGYESATGASPPP